MHFLYHQVMEAAKLKRESSDSHQQASLTLQAAQKKVKELNKNLKGAILKSRWESVYTVVLQGLIYGFSMVLLLSNLVMGIFLIPVFY